MEGFKDVPDRARVVGLQEIEKEGWTLNISRYVVPPVGEDIPPLHEAVAAFKQHSDAATRPKITCAA